MSTKILRPAALLAALLLVLPTAFADDGPVAPPKPAPKPDTATPNLELTSSTPMVKLISNGAEPRKVLRYKPAANTKMEFVATTTTDVKSPMMEMKIGPMSNTMHATYGKAADGAIPMKVKIIDAKMNEEGANPMMLQQMKQGLQDSIGVAVEGSASDMGIWSNAADMVKETAPGKKAAQEAMGTQMTGLMMPLPKEAVGVGASWSVSAKVKANRIEQNVMTTVTIEKIEGDRVEISFKQKNWAKDTTMAMMGQEMPIKSIDGKGGGTGTIDLALGGMVKSSSKLEIKMVMDMMGQVMETTTAVSSSIAGKPAAATTGGEAEKK